jgi:hypothetical protein
VLFLTTLLSLFLVVAPVKAASRVVMETIPATNSTIHVDTTSTRVNITTNSYNGGISNVGLHTNRNVVISSDSTNNVVIYSSGSIVLNGTILEGVICRAGSGADSMVCQGDSNGTLGTGVGAVVSGGADNDATGDYSLVPGGNNNTAEGYNSLASGQGAVATGDYSYVWSDGSDPSGESTTIRNHYKIRAKGGFYVNTTSVTIIGYVDVSSGIFSTRDIVAVGSMTANMFFGDGSHLTGIPSTASISGSYLPLTGGTVTGPTNIQGHLAAQSSMTVASTIISTKTAFSDGSSAYINGPGALMGFTQQSFSAASFNIPQIHLWAARGTATSSSAVAAADTIGGVFFRGYDGTTPNETATAKAIVMAYADNAYTANDNGMSLSFVTNKRHSSGITGRKSHLIITSTGTVHIGEFNAISAPLNLANTTTGYLSVDAPAGYAGSASIYATGEIRGLSFRGSGANLTSLPSSALTGAISAGLVDLSTVTTALATKLSNTTAIPGSLLDLSTYTFGGGESNTYTSSKTFTGAGGVLVNYGITAGSVTVPNFVATSTTTHIAGLSRFGNGTVGYVTVSADGHRLSLTRDNISHINATDAAGYLGFGTGGRDQDVEIKNNGDLQANKNLIGISSITTSGGLFGTTLAVSSATFTGRIAVPNGSQAVPAIGFTSSGNPPNTGIYATNGSYMEFGVNGVEYLEMTGLTVNAPLPIVGASSITTSGGMFATNFVGDGSGLTNLPSTGETNTYTSSKTFTSTITVGGLVFSTGSVVSLSSITTKGGVFASTILSTGITVSNSSYEPFKAGSGNYTNGAYARYMGFGVAGYIYNTHENGLAAGSTGRGAAFDYSGFVLGTDGAFGFTNGTDAAGTRDAGFSRISAGLVGVGNGTAGSVSGGIVAGSSITTSGGLFGTDSTVQIANATTRVKTPSILGTGAGGGDINIGQNAASGTGTFQFGTVILKTDTADTPVFRGGTSTSTVIRGYNDSNQVHIQPYGGNVGIRTTSPASTATLHVIGTVAISSTLSVGFGPSRASVGGSTFWKDYTVSGATVTNSTTEVYYDTWTITANTLDHQGACIVVRCNTQAGAGAGTYTHRLRLNGSTVATRASTTVSNDFRSELRLCRVTASTAVYFSNILSNTSTLSLAQGSVLPATFSFDSTVDNKIACTGQSNTGSATTQHRFYSMKGYLEN